MLFFINVIFVSNLFKSLSPKRPLKGEEEDEDDDNNNDDDNYYNAKNKNQKDLNFNLREDLTKFQCESICPGGLRSDLPDLPIYYPESLHSTPTQKSNLISPRCCIK